MEEKKQKGRGRQSASVAGRTRRAIIEAALRLFAERGFEGVSVRDIAERAGTTHGLIRHHFGSKEGVWRAVVDAADAEYVAALQPLATRVTTSPEANPTTAVAEIVRGLVLVSAKHPEIVRLLVREGSSGDERLDYILEHVQPLRLAVTPLFARLRRRGFLRQFDENTFFLFILMAAATPFALSALTTSILGEDILAEKNAHRHADRIIRTLFDDDDLSVA